MLAQKPEITQNTADLLLETLAESIEESLQLAYQEEQWLAERDYWQNSQY